jgi:hypothetical protein
MSMIRTTILAATLVAWAGAASAAQQCGATTHTVYGETRAYFQNTLGACRPDGYCSAVLALPDATGDAAFTQQLRIARPTPGAPYDVVLTAVIPSPTDDARPMSVALPTRSSVGAMSPTNGMSPGLKTSRPWCAGRCGPTPCAGPTSHRMDPRPPGSPSAASPVPSPGSTVWPPRHPLRAEPPQPRRRGVPPVFSTAPGPRRAEGSGWTTLVQPLGSPPLLALPQMRLDPE